MAPATLLDFPTLPPLATLLLPERLIYPLQQARGLILNPVVKPGQMVFKGQVIATDANHPPLHAASSGEVQPLQPYPLPYASGGYGDCLVIVTDGEDVPLDVETENVPLKPEILLQRIEQAGIVGLGGAGFSAAEKLRTGLDQGLNILIINGVECEPLITCDQTLLTHWPHKVLQGARLLCQTLSIPRCLLAVEADKFDVRHALETAWHQGDYPTISLNPVPPRYPAGSEKQLIQVLTGHEVPHDGLPQDLGIVCLNAATVAAIQDALTEEHSPLMTRLVTVTGGGVMKPHNLQVRIGTPMIDLIDFCGGYREDAQGLVVGGAMMGHSLPSDAAPVVKTTNCLWIPGPDEWAATTTEQACIRCGACAEVCPVGLLPQLLYRYAHADDWEQVTVHHLHDCIECGCCDVVCPSHIPLVRQFRLTKKRLAVKHQEESRAHHARSRYEARLARKAREEQERAEIARRKKENLDKNRNLEIQGRLARLKAKRQTDQSGS